MRRKWGNSHKRLVARIAIVENISCQRVLCRGIWTSTLKMPRFKTPHISSLTKITILPNKFVLSKSNSTISSSMTCTCNPNETGKKVVSKVINRLCHSYRKAGRSILASDWSTYFRLLSLAVGCKTVSCPRHFSRDHTLKKDLVDTLAALTDRCPFNSDNHNPQCSHIQFPLFFQILFLIVKFSPMLKFRGKHIFVKFD